MHLRIFDLPLKTVLLILVAVVALPILSVAQNDYYFPDADEAAFDEQIPSPQAFLGYEIGTHYTRHDRIVAYFEKLADISDKAEFQVIGETYQKRPQVVLTISAPENHQNIEQIRQDHLTLLDPDAPSLDPEEGKSIVALNYSVHGDETSSGEAALLTAYYLIANESEETQNFLEETVIHIDPAQNPDGRDRAAHWHNSYKSFPPVADPADAEHNQAWPRGRTNHFLHDLNRDWFAITQQESGNRIDFYHQWYPNVQIDFHEMGTNSTYYLEPTQPERTWNPVIPEHHYTEMNPLLAQYHTDALDNLGALYWTKEVFDNISPIYGSTYPDIQGGVGVTFEVGSSRGLVQESDAGEVPFRSTIRKHLHTGIATVRGAVAEKERFLEYQKDYFRSALEQADSQPTRAYVFGDADDLSLTNKFLDLLLKHRLDVYEINQNVEENGHQFEADSSYVVPTDQIHYRVIHDIFEANTSFPDSVFYDITGWSLVHGYGIQYEEVESNNFQDYQGQQVTELPGRNGMVEGGKSEYAYLLKWSDYNASPALYDLLDSDITSRVAHQPFTANTAVGEEEFGYGTVVISVREQDLSPDELYQKVQETANAHNVTFYAVDTGMTPQGIDLGSNNVQPVEKPKVALVIGRGTSSYEVGEAWFLLNKHVGIEATKIRHPQFPQVDLDRYNTIVLVDGNYSDWSEQTVDKLNRWVRSGGTLITNEDASEWAIRQDIVSEDLIKTFEEDTAETPPRYDYEERSDRWRASTIPGTILEADIDLSNPIAFGAPDQRQLFIKNSSFFLKQSQNNPYATVAKYTDEPFVGGHINEENLDKVRNTAAISVQDAGRGTVVLFADDPNFRSYWHTTSRLFLNAIFFGQHL